MTLAPILARPKAKCVKPALTADILRIILKYDGSTGDFVWRVRNDVRKSWNTRYAGKSAGYIWKIGRCSYRVIRIFDWPFLAHRLAWLYATGSWPAVDIDHRDTNGLNNRWENLREATKTENSANTVAKKNNKSGFKGVTIHKGRYRANIGFGGKQKLIGYFDSAEEAHAAYTQALREAMGDFARSS